MSTTPTTPLPAVHAMWTSNTEPAEAWSARTLVAYVTALFSLVLGLASFCVWAGDVGPLAGFGLMISIMGLIALPLSITSLLVSITQGRRFLALRVLPPVIVSLTGLVCSLVGTVWLLHSLLTVVVK